MTTRIWLDRKPISSQSTPVHKKNDFHIGDQVTVNNLSGTIRFIGTTAFKAGTWIGIELDKIGTGKNNGSIQGYTYSM
jgi:dynactin complex subunit